MEIETNQNFIKQVTNPDSDMIEFVKDTTKLINKRGKLFKEIRLLEQERNDYNNESYKEIDVAYQNLYYQLAKVGSIVLEGFDDIEAMADQLERIDHSILEEISMVKTECLAGVPEKKLIAHFQKKASQRLEEETNPTEDFQS